MCVPVCPDLSDVDYLEDSTTESLLLSGDDLSQEDLAMEAFPPEEPQDSQEIVRCVCQMDEENGFMIQVTYDQRTPCLQCGHLTSLYQGGYVG